MREIKFRGKSLNTGEWVYGGYYNLPDCLKGDLRHIIVYQNMGLGQQTIHEPIDANALGQCTGLKDKNGKEIYDGDIVKNDYRGMGKVEICETGAYVVRNNEKQIYYILQHVKVEVIGNIYENPELLEER